MADVPGAAPDRDRAVRDLGIPGLAIAREVAAMLPGVHEVPYHDDPWFNIGRKSYALWSSTERCWILKLPKPLQARLFEEDPDTFIPMRAGKLLWSYVVVERLADDAFRDLLVAAWRTIALKRVQAEFDARNR